MPVGKSGCAHWLEFSGGKCLHGLGAPTSAAVPLLGEVVETVGSVVGRWLLGPVVAVVSRGECGVGWLSCDDGGAGGMFGDFPGPRLSLGKRGFPQSLVNCLLCPGNGRAALRLRSSGKRWATSNCCRLNRRPIRRWWTAQSAAQATWTTNPEGMFRCFTRVDSSFLVQRQPTESHPQPQP